MYYVHQLLFTLDMLGIKCPAVIIACISNAPLAFACGEEEEIRNWLML
jgi:hypothetical protein